LLVYADSDEEKSSGNDDFDFVRQKKREIFTELLYRETSTLGVRISEIERDCLPREIAKVETEFGAVDVKIARFNGKIVNAKPEYEQIRRNCAKIKPHVERNRKRIFWKNLTKIKVYKLAKTDLRKK
jgi:uncharacterized protein (DUF111 family)